MGMVLVGMARLWLWWCPVDMVLAWSYVSVVVRGTERAAGWEEPGLR